MNTARGFFHLIRISLTVFATICPFDVAAESPNADSFIDDLFRKAGISKISQGAAADFALRDLSGNTVTLGSYRGSLVARGLPCWPLIKRRALPRWRSS